VNAARRVVVEAAFTEAERPIVAAVDGQLAACLAAASGAPWDIDVRRRDRIDSVDARDGPTLAIASLATELGNVDESLASIGARWHERLASLVQDGVPAVIVCTVFRRAAAPLPTRGPVASAPPIERIRRLDRLAVDLSQATGAWVADLDRVFAHFGARQLEADPRTGGAIAAEVAAWTIVSTAFATGLDDLLALDAQERARAFLGDLAGVPAFVGRRLRR
jgi:hypothetical protein